jgi:hypothetical protein
MQRSFLKKFDLFSHYISKNRRNLGKILTILKIQGWLTQALVKIKWFLNILSIVKTVFFCPTVGISQACFGLNFKAALAKGQRVGHRFCSSVSHMSQKYTFRKSLQVYRDIGL